MFYGGTNTPPNDMRIISWECDFLKEDIVNSEESQNFALKWIMPGMAIVVLFINVLHYF